MLFYDSCASQPASTHTHAQSLKPAQRVPQVNRTIYPVQVCQLFFLCVRSPVWRVEVELVATRPKPARWTAAARRRRSAMAALRLKDIRYACAHVCASVHVSRGWASVRSCRHCRRSVLLLGFGWAHHACNVFCVVFVAPVWFWSTSVLGATSADGDATHGTILLCGQRKVNCGKKNMNGAGRAGAPVTSPGRSESKNKRPNNMVFLCVCV